MRINYYQPKDKKENPIVGKISWIKKMIKEFGGCGYTEHYERDGSLFEVTYIELNKNNSNHKYNRHL